ncbi:MAG: cyclodeaminase/cyclohydrolase family protein [Chloroflexi bacterium]|nr:cyclodeaminase/cyclohydrolase family protein [Chloroflexota bacterium]
MTHAFSNQTVNELLDALASSAPAPGGGAACALAGALGAALVSMVANLTLDKAAAPGPELQDALAQADELRAALVGLMEDDANAYDAVIAAYRLPRSTAAEKKGRREAIQQALRVATLVPLDIAANCARVLALTEPAARLGSRSAVTDAGAAAYLATASARAALLNVDVNLKSIKDEAFVAWAQERAQGLEALLAAAQGAALDAMTRSLAASA